MCHRIDPMPSAGITEDAVHFMLADGEEFRPEPTPGTAFYETMSELRTIRLPDFLQSGQTVTVNGRTMRPGVNYPPPPQRNEGYIIRTTNGATFTAR